MAWLSLAPMAARPRLSRLGIPALVLAGGLLGIVAHRSLGVDWSPGSLPALVAQLGFWAPAAFVLLIGLRTPLLLPSQLVLTASGLCFGTVLGTLVGTLGLLLSASLAFALGRSVGAEALQRPLRHRLQARLERALAAAGSRGGAGLLALATGYPFGPTTAFHAAAPLTGMRFRVFLLAVGTGAAVRAWTFAYFGSSLAHAHWTAAAVSGALLGGALLPFLHPGVRSWAIRTLGPYPEGSSQGVFRVGR